MNRFREKYKNNDFGPKINSLIPVIKKNFREYNERFKEKLKSLDMEPAMTHSPFGA